MTTLVVVHQGFNRMAYYLTSDESLCGQAPSRLAGAYRAPLERHAAIETPAARAEALLASLLRCVNVGSALDTIRSHVEGLLAVTSISWQVDDERYCGTVCEPSEHTIPVALSLDDRPFGRLRLHSRRPVGEAELAALREMLAVVAYPLRNLRMLEHALIAAEHDALTGLKNRRAFDLELKAVHARVARYGGQASLLILDMTRFKAINDTYGHDVGDRALARVAEGLDRCLRETDSAYRLGGDEFVVILPETPYQGARRLGARLLDWFRDHPLREPGGERVPLRARIGMAQFREGDDADGWFRRADQALYGNPEPNGAGRRLGRLA
ncbi:GGDEF domain-containing protein [Guyparkeria hydrothermalis]|uniref:GGDEF domain-containing protein n=2 Tax=Guyparkeria TaxID=2035712 RepID=UPI0010AD808D|nr:GGDEF domain-containing protein [Guyparkeria hydrothermalis]MCL7752016.1 GGDEF domain-containing protein [Guyparkeria hydrothermalis]TKA89278.1 GGDEF domain-containing protein [Guyparkeria sp. SB14A]